jgi:hypothetical protein
MQYKNSLLMANNEILLLSYNVEYVLTFKNRASNI